MVFDVEPCLFEIIADLTALEEPDSGAAMIVVVVAVVTFPCPDPAVVTAVALTISVQSEM